MLASGANGCVFYKPRLLCEDEPEDNANDNQISKVVLATKSSKEVEMNKMVFDTLKLPLANTKKCKPKYASIDRCFLSSKQTELELLIMPYGGTELFNLLSADPMDPNVTKEFPTNFKRLFRDIALISSIGMVHRDIKPENILFNVDPYGELNLIDFEQMIPVNDLAITLYQDKQKYPEIFSNDTIPREWNPILDQTLQPQTIPRYFQQFMDMSIIERFKSDVTAFNTTERNYQQDVLKASQTYDLVGLAYVMFTIMKQTGLLKEYESFFYKCLTPNLTERLLPVEAFVMLCVKLTHENKDIDPHYKIVSNVTDGQLVDFPKNLLLAEIIMSVPDDLPREFDITSINLTFLSDPKWKPLPLAPLLRPLQSSEPPPLKQFGPKTRKCIKQNEKL
jgi:serine/threonine protein kinase